MAHFTDEQIKHMVQRFLSWKLPKDFNPDAGISFKPWYNEHTNHPMQHEPYGTNLFDAQQAKEMIQHMLEGLPEDGSEAVGESSDSLRERCREMLVMLHRDGILRQRSPVETLMAFVLAETGRTADPQLAETLPLCLYFNTDADRDEFIAGVREILPNLVSRKLP